MPYGPASIGGVRVPSHPKATMRLTFCLSTISPVSMRSLQRSSDGTWTQRGKISYTQSASFMSNDSVDTASREQIFADEDQESASSYSSETRRSDANLAKTTGTVDEGERVSVPLRRREGLPEAKIAEYAITPLYRNLSIRDRIRFAERAVAAWPPNYKFVPLELRRVRPELAKQAVAACAPNIIFVPEGLLDKI